MRQEILELDSLNRYVTLLRSGEIWADEGVMTFLSKHFSLQLLVLKSDNYGNVSHFRFPFQSSASHCAVFRFVHHHYDNVLVNKNYSFPKSKIDESLHKLWWGSV